MVMLMPSNLETITYNAGGWNFIFDKNVELLAQVLLDITSMRDVDNTDAADGDVLTYHTSGLVFKPRSYA